MNFEINPSSTVPIFRQIIDQVRRYIASGQLRSGDGLPSVRSVALDHAINPMTVSKAYSMLEADGVLSRLRGVGMVVSDRRTIRKDKMVLLKPAIISAVKVARQLQLSDEEVQALLQTCLNEWKVDDSNE